MVILENILYFAIAIGVLIAIHEAGHFFMARACGVYVERFSLGFGPVLFSVKDKYQTEYSLSLIPLGGYVKMLGESAEAEQELTEEQKKQAFSNKKVWQRFLIVAAGPFMNIFLAWFLYSFVFMLGVESVKPAVEVYENSPAQIAGFKNDDIIVQVGNVKVLDWEETLYELISHIKESVEIVVEGNFGKGPKRTLLLSLEKWELDPRNKELLKDIGLEPKSYQIFPIIDFIQSGSAASESKLEKGDKVLSYGLEPELDKLTEVAKGNVGWNKIINFIQANPNKTIWFNVERDGVSEPILIDLVPSAKKDENGKEIGYLGISPKGEARPELYINRQYSFFDAIFLAAKKTINTSVVTLKFIGKFLIGDISVKNVSGPIGIAKGAGLTARLGFVVYLGFLALISVNLGILNLLPVPVLDGGHLAFYIIEAIRGKPISEKVMNGLLKVGMSLLLMLMILAVFNDIVFGW